MLDLNIQMVQLVLERERERERESERARESLCACPQSLTTHSTSLSSYRPTSTNNLRRALQLQSDDVSLQHEPDRNISTIFFGAMWIQTLSDALYTVHSISNRMEGFRQHTHL